MKRITNIMILLSVFTLSFVFAQDVTLSLDGQNLNYISTEDIAGWQFSHDGCALGSSGGDSSANGFTISCSEGTCLAFSFSGAVIPEGSGTLVDLNGDCTEASLSEFILSGPNGLALSSEFSSGPPDPVLGCMDASACNFDADATEDDGSCSYAEENHDCDGNCTVEVDCAGVCAGSSELDECDVCGGDGSSCEETIIPIYYESDTDIAGFQFNVDGATVLGASGGAAADAEVLY